MDGANPMVQLLCKALAEMGLTVERTATGVAPYILSTQDLGRIFAIISQ